MDDACPKPRTVVIEARCVRSVTHSYGDEAAMVQERRFGRIVCDVCGVSYIGEMTVVRTPSGTVIREVASTPCPNAANHKERSVDRERHVVAPGRRREPGHLDVRGQR